MSKEIIITEKKVVSCNGLDEGGSGHPKVWLKIKETETFIDCPYCEIRFLKKEDTNKDNEHGQ
tara:strand:- start:28 stop:216 length:189 start_codon:yes stop_codon:yes gene_type:complete